jgi:hypothetical protein
MLTVGRVANPSVPPRAACTMKGWGCVELADGNAAGYAHARSVQAVSLAFLFSHRSRVMGYFKWMLGGLIGAAIGGLVWVAVGYFLNYEIGYIAWGIGLLAGIGVSVAASDSDQGFSSGIAAVAAAALVIVVSKWAVVNLAIDKELAEARAMAGENSVSTEDMIALLADEVVEEREAAGKPVTLPEVDYATATTEQTYPADVWAEGKQRWEALDPVEQERRRDEHNRQMNEFMEAFIAGARDAAFKESFSGFDLLWFALAAMTAFRVGSGGNKES